MIGEKGQWILSPRLDDLECVFATMKGMLSAEPQNFIALSAFFDNEEVGSGTKQGADSTFLPQTIAGIGDALSCRSPGRDSFLAGAF